VENATLAKSKGSFPVRAGRIAGENIGRLYRCPTNDYNDYYSHYGDDMTKPTAIWAVAKAKSKLSAVIDRALAEGPQTITRHGRKAVVVVSAEEWERKAKRKGNLAEFFAASPLSGSRLRIRRSNAKAREIAL
jgi:prevent-host-death family protein